MGKFCGYQHLCNLRNLWLKAGPFSPAPVCLLEDDAILLQRSFAKIHGKTAATIRLRARLRRINTQQTQAKVRGDPNDLRLPSFFKWQERVLPPYELRITPCAVRCGLDKKITAVR